MNTSRVLPIIVAIFLIACVCEIVAAVVVVGGLGAETEIAIAEPTETATALPTPTRVPATLTPTVTASPTFTRTLTSSPTLTAIHATPTKTKTPSPTATARLASPYDVFIPTPTAPPLAYPIDFQSTTKMVTYTVTGKTLNEISASLEKNALADPHEPDSAYYARTNWSIQGQRSWTPTTRGCEVDRGTVTVAITITLPALKTTTGVSADVLNRWNTFIRNTSAHEQGHARLALEGARTYQRNLGNLAPAANCDVIQTQLRDQHNRDFDAIDRVNVKYDTDTQHGLTQGAVFP